MNQQVIWAIVAVAIVAAAAVVWYVMNRRRTEQLRERFGPEYDHVVEESGDIRKAEASLQARAKRVAKLHIHPLTPDEAARFSASWQRVQAQFVDDPERAITEADKIVGAGRLTRG